MNFSILGKNISTWFKAVVEDEFSQRINNPKYAAMGRAEQIDVIRANLGAVTLGNILAGFLTVLTFVGDPQFFKATVWYVFFLVFLNLSIRASGKWPASLTKGNTEYNDGEQVLSALVLGLLWVAMPIVMLEGASLEQQLFIVATILSLIGVGALFLSGIPRAAVTFTITMSAGLIFAMAINWHARMMNPAMLTIAFTLLIIGMIRINSTFLVDRMTSKIALVESNEVIGVLLREHEDSGYEWLWETGVNGVLVNVSKKFANAAGIDREDMNDTMMRELLAKPKSDGPKRRKSDKCNIDNIFSANQPFRDNVVSYCHPDGKIRWWKLSGRPIVELGDNEQNVTIGYRGVALDITDSKRSEEKIAYLALYDSLTNLPNRASFREQMKSSIAKMSKDGSGLAFFVLDLDKFKNINDTLGHPAGDELLFQVSDRLSSECENAAIVARLGGDEFAVLLDDVLSVSEAAAYAVRLMNCFAKPFYIAEREMVINCSIGVSLAPVHGKNAEDLIKYADLALYRAKVDNNSSFNIFEADMDLQVRERRMLDLELQNAIKNDELYLLYQPMLCTATDTIIGYEALVRWENPRCGIVNPAHFIPIAEENGTIVNIGKWVIRQACKEAASWNNDRRISVNLSPLQFVGIQLEAVVAVALSDSGLDPKRLELEITENSLMVNKVATLNALQNMRRLGISIALDDFGTGYSSLSYLLSYPFDKIKIDRSFLTMEGDIEDDSHGNNATLIRTIIGLAKSLGMRTTAEGVESVKHLEFLKREGCDEIQGYLISQPVPPSAIEAGEDAKNFLENIERNRAYG